MRLLLTSPQPFRPTAAEVKKAKELWTEISDAQTADVNRLRREMSSKSVCNTHTQ